MDRKSRAEDSDPRLAHAIDLGRRIAQLRPQGRLAVAAMVAALEDAEQHPLRASDSDASHS